MRAIDLFAGWGGFTAGATAAGAEVLWAANHWPVAVEAHAHNHPTTEHVCQDLRQADWSTLPGYDLLLAAPACQGHSTASQPKRRRYHDALRATAWAVVDCADATSPEAVIVENVPSFRDWRLYPVWRLALESLGYSLREVVLRASLLGVPQRRDRLFVVALRPAAAKRWRAPAQADHEASFRPCLDLASGRWRPVASAPVGARARLDASRRFGDLALVQHVTGHAGVSVDGPIRTITTKDQWVVRRGDEYRPLTVDELARGMGFPRDYHWPKTSRADAIRGLGNAVCPPVGAAITRSVLDAA